MIATEMRNCQTKGVAMSSFWFEEKKGKLKLLCCDLRADGWCFC